MAPRVLITGGSGFLGKHLVERLRARGYDVLAPTREELDLEARDAAAKIVRLRPAAIFHLAAYFGGLHFVRVGSGALALRNAAINQAVVLARTQLPKTRLVACGSACQYPANLAAPAGEDHALSGPLHETVRDFAETKRALVRFALTQGETAAIFTTVYGPGDHVEDPVRAHFLGGLLSRIEAARREGIARVAIWGSGTPVRDCVFVRDAVSALVFLYEQNARGVFNIASDDAPRSIAAFASAVRDAVGYRGDLGFDSSFADGQRFKALDTQRVRAAGWRALTDLDSGLRETVTWMRRDMGLNGADEVPPPSRRGA